MPLVGVDMLKISRTDGNNDAAAVLKLEGQVRGRWVDELRRACVDLLVQERGALALDLSDVSFIDDAGIELFSDLAARQVVFSNCSLFAAEQLKAVTK